MLGDQGGLILATAIDWNCTLQRERVHPLASPPRVDTSRKPLFRTTFSDENLSREELAACYAHADIFALPSTGEGFGLVFLEAMAFGCPLAGAAWGGTTDLVKDGVNGLLVPPHDPDRLAEALGCLLRDDALRAELGRHGREIVRRKFSFEVFRDELEKILNERGLDSNSAT